MSHKKADSILFCGCGYIGTLSAALCIHELEAETGRSCETRLMPRAELSVSLQELLDTGAPKRLYIVGMGLNLHKVGQGENEIQRLIDLFAALQKQGCSCVWFCNWHFSQDDEVYRPYMEIVCLPDQHIGEPVLQHFQPDEEKAAALRKIFSKDKSPIYKELFNCVGWLTRVMRGKPELGKEAIRSYLSFRRQNGDEESMFPNLRHYLKLFRTYGHREIKGKSSEMENLREEIRRVAAHEDVRVLILGESGTGKESVATHLHFNSPRWDKPFLTFNCASTNAQLLEASFLGFKKGSFTGAVQNRDGIFKQADGGSLFLDEIGDLPLEAQGTLLRILEEKRYTPMGGSKEEKVDVRLITATNRNLQQMVQEGSFRQDLLFRLQEYCIRTWPLRCIKSDIPIIIRAIWRQKHRHDPPMDKDDIAALQAYDWPGNARELSNFLKYVEVQSGDEKSPKDWARLLQGYHAMQNGMSIRPAAPADIPAHATASGDKPRAQGTLAKTEADTEPPAPEARGKNETAPKGEPATFLSLAELTRLHCRRAMELSHGNSSQAARLLGIHRNTLQKHLATPMQQES